MVKIPVSVGVSENTIVEEAIKELKGAVEVTMKYVITSKSSSRKVFADKV